MGKILKGFNYEYKKILAKDICSANYQRETNASRVSQIVEEFDANLVNPVKVSLRDGKYWGFDGLHTTNSLINVFGEDCMIDCKVYYGMTYEDEAYYFALQNGRSKPVTKSDKMRAKYLSGDKEMADLKEICEEYGFVMDFSTKNGTKKLVCVAKLETIYFKKGRDALRRALKLIKETWNYDADSIRGEIVGGTAELCYTYGDLLDDQRFISKLKSVAPIEIYRSGKSCEDKTLKSGDFKYSYFEVKQYNKNGGKKVLDEQSIRKTK